MAIFGSSTRDRGVPTLQESRADTACGRIAGIIPLVTYQSPAMAENFLIPFEQASLLSFPRWAFCGSVILEKCVVFVVLVVSVAVAIARRRDGCRCRRVRRRLFCRRLQSILVSGRSGSNIHVG